MSRLLPIKEKGGFSLRVLSLRAAVAMLVALAVSAPAHALDPITLIFLRALRDHAISNSIETLATQPATVPTLPPPSQYPGGLDDRKLRQLIDEGFIHLSNDQRTAVYVEVRKILNDPQHFASRPIIIEELAIKASATRQAHERLRALTPSEKRELVSAAREEYTKLTPSERSEMLSVLRSGQLPIPRDLTEMMLASLPEPVRAEEELQARN